MCGFAGFISAQPSSLKELEVFATRMAKSLAHRGPDDAGAWADAQAGVALGFRRLSIIDLSPAGHQPMVSSSGRYVIVFNGEVYNHLGLRAELERMNPHPREDYGNNWRGHSDTETLLAGFERWGIEATLNKIVGMFAIALWDARERTLHLARDRFGEKPMFYGWVDNDGADVAWPTFVFGSELKALRAFPGFANPVCRGALAQYMRFMYVPAPRSIYQGVYKLEPGCLLSIRGRPPRAAPILPLRPPTVFESMTLSRWWSLVDLVQAGASTSITDEVEAVNALEHRLADAVRLQSSADVPLGAFLSGGVDSSTIVALMQEQASRPIKTFTVGFEEAEFDESPHAHAVARHLGTEHTELFVTAAEAQLVIAQLPIMYDEPFADSSQIPTHLVCRSARQRVTVVLSGDAGDEQFGGYNRYFWQSRLWAKLARVPYPIRQALGAAISAVPVVGWDALSRSWNALLPSNLGIARAGDKAHKLATRLRRVSSIDELSLSSLSEWQDPAQVVRGEGPGLVVEPPSLLNDPLPQTLVEEGNSVLRMMYHDSITYLPDDILCKVDRAAMACSLETRMPFLDHRVVELVWRLPLDMKIRKGISKWALRQVLYKRVPKELIERPKAGFAIPVGHWLRGPLREWADALLNPSRLNAEGYLHPEPITKVWQEHLLGHCDHTPKLWAVLMFQAWLEAQSKPTKVA